MNSTIEKRVMANVGAIYFARTLFGATAFKVYALVLSGLALWKFVWVSRVLENFLTVEKYGLGALTRYMFDALQHASIMVDAMLLICLVALFSLVFDAFRSLTPARRFA